jgi:hypothetical protein
MALTLGQAAKTAKVSKAAIHQAIGTGRLSATKDDLGRWQIDPAELSRLYPLNPIQGEEVDDSERPNLPTQRETDALRERIAAQEETIADLRRRLDQEAEERRLIQTRLTALLTDQRTPRRRWWPWGR